MIPSVTPSTAIDLAPDGKLTLLERFLDRDDADRWLKRARCLPWRREEVVMFGNRIDAPRDTLWSGDDGASYRYSGTRRTASGWGALEMLRSSVEAVSGCAFNFVLGTRYGSGSDTVGWHSDDERDLGSNPTIAVASFGVARDFQFRPRGGGAPTTVVLPHGSLLIMRGDFQAAYQHRVPRRKRVLSERYSFSFRRTVSANA